MKFLRSILPIAVLLIIVSCSKKEESVVSRPINQIQSEIGIPVVVKELERTNLTVMSDYTAFLEGSDQVKVFGLLGDDLKEIKVKTGDQVQKDDILAEFNTDNPQAQYRQAKINFETIEKTYNRMKSVFESGGISQQQMDEIAAKYDASRETFTAASKMIEIKAPISGVVTDVYVTEGQRVAPSVAILEIAQTSKLKAKVFVEGDKLPFLKIGDEVLLKTDLYTTNFIGEIDKISLSANTEKRGFSVEVIIDNKSSKLKPGIFGTLYFKTTNLDDVISVPRNSIINIANKNYVYVVGKDGLAQMREIKKGITAGDSVVVESGIQAGERLVIEGQSKLKNNAKVNIVE
ncbi:MAG: efflux RND transporter periplasmic adaptor subunit [Candidatus Delongbacteria bacterium]|nr:efflux RND transporter periplasmic adaptor subunit [Candidatus Delongbacteria bacterium]MBN2834767.1 efflux RND transporter periplasmic adaptor subunit [Candidatus Delongbacteria bacterium]